MASEEQLDASVRYSVQTQLPEYYGAGLTHLGYLGEYAHALPSIYDPRRQSVLAKIALHPQNSLWQGATAGLSRDIAGAPWEITGKRRVKWYQNILLNAQKGAGWSAFVQALLWQFYNSDDGAVVEIIGRGDPSTPLDREQITSIAVLDSARCYFTGHAEYPVWYQDAQTGELHKLHTTRVYRMTDQPLADPLLRGRGFCALSRSWAFIQQSIVHNTYVGESLSNTPPPGILLVNGVVQAKWKDAWDMYQAALNQRGTTQYMPIVEYVNPDSDKRVVIEFVRFSQRPEGLDPVVAVEIQAKGIALGLSIDPQDVWPLSGGSFGTNTQSRVLDKKAKGKAVGFILAMFTRFINDRVLPDPLRFESKYRDAEQSAEQAENAQRHAAVAKEVAALAGERGSEIALRYLARTVDTLADVLLDADGQLITLFDDDVNSEAEAQAAQSVTDVSATVAPEDQTSTSERARKDYDDVLLRFSRDMYSAIEGANDEDYNRRRAGIILRAIIAKEGRAAYLEGLKAGGFDEGILDAYDAARYDRLVTEASGYVSNLTARIYGQGLSEAQIRASVTAWGNKTLQKFYLWGLESADRNALMKFGGQDGKESCIDCRRLKGKIYRMYEWAKARLRPQVDTENFQCGGWQCEHRLERAGKGSRRSRGDLKSFAHHHHHEGGQHAH